MLEDIVLWDRCQIVSQGAAWDFGVPAGGGMGEGSEAISDFLKEKPKIEGFSRV